MASLWFLWIMVEYLCVILLCCIDLCKLHQSQEHTNIWQMLNEFSVKFSLSEHHVIMPVFNIFRVFQRLLSQLWQKIHISDVTVYEQFTNVYWCLFKRFLIILTPKKLFILLQSVSVTNRIIIYIKYLIILEIINWTSEQKKKWPLDEIMQEFKSIHCDFVQIENVPIL